MQKHVFGVIGEREMLGDSSLPNLYVVEIDRVGREGKKRGLVFLLLKNVLEELGVVIEVRIGIFGGKRVLMDFRELFGELGLTFVQIRLSYFVFLFEAEKGGWE